MAQKSEGAVKSLDFIAVQFAPGQCLKFLHQLPQENYMALPAGGFLSVPFLLPVVEDNRFIVAADRNVLPGFSKHEATSLSS